MARPTRAFALSLACVVATGLALRALYLLTIGRNVTGIGDWFFYHWQANDLAAGRFFVEPYRLRFDHVSLASAGHPPLYPLALSVVSAIGGTGVLAHRAMGLLFGVVTMVLVGLLGRRAAGDRVGLIAASLCAIYPLMIAVDGALMSETLYGWLIAAVLLLTWRMLDRPGKRLAAASGAVLGLAALTRSEAVLLLPLLLLPAAWRGAARGRALRMAAVVVGLAVVIAPWTVRNIYAFGRVVPISNNDATVLAGANCPKTYAGPNVGSWDFSCISPRRVDNEAEQAAIWRSQAVNFARDHIGRLPVVAATRLLRVWDLYQPRRQVLFAEGRQIRVEQAGIAAYALLAILGVAGALLLRRRGVPLLVLLAPAVAVSVAAVTGYGIPRLRHAFEPSLLVLAAVALEAAWMRRSARRTRSGTSPTAVA